MKMKKHALAAAVVLCMLSAVLGGCTMQFSPGASALLGSGDAETTVSAGTLTPNPSQTSSDSVSTSDAGETASGSEVTTDTSSTETGNVKPTETQTAVTPENFKCKELEILSSGSFYTVCERYDENGELTSMTIANTPSSVYMMLTVANVQLGVLMKDGTMYMINENEKTYIELNAVALKIMKIDPSELKVESIGSMPDVKPETCEEITYKDGIKATLSKYTDGDNSIEIISRDDKLFEMNEVTDGVTVSRMVFSFVTDDIPENKRSIPSSYEKPGLWEFFKPIMNSGLAE